MPYDAALQTAGFVYGRSGSTRGSTTSSGVFVVNTGFPHKTVFGFALDAGNGLRNSNADPAATTGVGTFTYYRWITPVGQQARFRGYRDQTLSAASALVGSSRRQTLATVVTAQLVNWIAWGY